MHAIKLLWSNVLMALLSNRRMEKHFVLKQGNSRWVQWFLPNWTNPGTTSKIKQRMRLGTAQKFI